MAASGRGARNSSKAPSASASAKALARYAEYTKRASLTAGLGEALSCEVFDGKVFTTDLTDLIQDLDKG